MSESNALFNRQAEVLIGPKFTPNQNDIPVGARQFLNRVNFEIEKNSESNPNKGKISLYNLSPESRSYLEQKNLIVFLRAGYQDFIETLFLGDIIRPTTVRQGPDLVTTLECGDKELLITQAHIEIGLGPNATNIQVLDQAIAKLGITVGARLGTRVITYPNGFTFSGLVRVLLDQLTKQMGIVWNVQDGELQLLPSDQDIGVEAIVVSPQTGLIGWPTKTEDGFEAVSLLNPKIKPGRAVKLESKQFQEQSRSTLLASRSLKSSGNNFVLNRCVYTGDSHEGPWQVRMEGKSIG